MPAYLVITADVHDRQAFITGYAPAAAEIMQKFGGEYVLRAPGAELLEGDSGDGTSVVVSKWPDKAAALRFWNSEEYTAAKKMREGIADCRILLVEAP